MNGWRNFAPFFGATNTYCRGLADHARPAELLVGLRLRRGHLHELLGRGHHVAIGHQRSARGLHHALRELLRRLGFAEQFPARVAGHDQLHADQRLGGPAILAFPPHGVWARRSASARGVTQNNDGILYAANGSDARIVHIALMGDPTLRMHIVAPPSALVVSTNAYRRSGSELELRRPMRCWAITSIARRPRPGRSRG